MSQEENSLEPDQPSGDITVVRLRPEYVSTDFDGLAELEGCLLDRLSQGPNGLLIDMARTKFVGAGFLGVLLRCRRRAKLSHQEFALCRVDGWPELLLDVTRLDALLDIYPTTEAAIFGMTRFSGDEETEVIRNGNGVRHAIDTTSPFPA